MRAAGVAKPRAVVISTSDAERALQSVTSVRAAFGMSVPIFCRAKDPPHAEALRAMGATGVVLDSGIEAGLLLGAVVLQEIGVPAQATVNIANQLRTAIQTAQGASGESPSVAFSRRVSGLVLLCSGLTGGGE